jgi:6-pyruvoyltetrahydropterin/6-carboxytetrahydropterin synthase
MNESKTYSCTRRLEFDSAHRVMLHESKCRNLHGHRYVVEVTAQADKLDSLGRVVDFSVLKSVLGGWLDKEWDHGMIANKDDLGIIEICELAKWKVYKMLSNPTAESMAEHLYVVFNALLREHDTALSVSHIRLYETPNCWADWPAL